MNNYIKTIEIDKTYECEEVDSYKIKLFVNHNFKVINDRCCYRSVDNNKVTVCVGSECKDIKVNSIINEILSLKNLPSINSSEFTICGKIIDFKVRYSKVNNNFVLSVISTTLNLNENQKLNIENQFIGLAKNQNMPQNITTNNVQGDQINGNGNNILKNNKKSQIAIYTAQVPIDKSEFSLNSIVLALIEHPTISILLFLLVLGFVYSVLKDIPFEQLKFGDLEFKFK